MRSLSLVRALVLAACAAAAPACDDHTNGDPRSGAGDLGAAPDLGVTDGAAPAPDRDAACASVSSIGTLSKKPVDIIFVIDNSGSMTDKIQAVQQNLNTSFAQLIGASGLDYRIIMISLFGDVTVDRAICIAAPLSGDSCVPPLPRRPTNGARYFQDSVAIGSNDSFSRVLDSWPEWSPWLRPNAAKIFVEITDDEELTMKWTDFDAALLSRAPAQFGTASARNYVFHAITGIAAKPNPTEAYLPTEPIVAEGTKCPMSENSGTAYQNLATLTGGLRFPVCDPSKFATVFQAIAKGIITGSQVACTLDVPQVAPPATVDLTTARVEYQPSSGGPAQSFVQTQDATTCAAGRYYIDGGERLVLCPDTCQAVQADANAAVRVWFDCDFPIP